MEYFLSLARNSVFDEDDEGRSFYSTAIARQNINAIAIMRKLGVRDSYYKRKGYTQAEIFKVSQFYNPPEGAYQVNNENREYYLLALEDCNQISVIYRREHTIYKRTFFYLMSGPPPKFNQCMEAMGFKNVENK
jgi:hypothetical protein